MQDHSLNESLLHQYHSTHLLGHEVTRNRIVFLTNNHLTLVNMESSGPSGLTDMVKLNGKNVLRFATDKKNKIALLYASGVLEVRDLDKIQQVQYKFTSIECRKSTPVGVFKNRGSNLSSSAPSPSDFPKLYWDNNDIYLLYEDKMEIISMAMKERKAYNDIIASTDGEKIKGMTLSNLIENERIIIMQFNNKLTFNIVPIPITYMSLPNVTQIQAVYSLQPPAKQATMPREYLFVVQGQHVLQLYNIISMKLLFEIDYQKRKPKQGEEPISIEFQTDSLNEYLLVSLSKGKVPQRSVLYKINADYYYSASRDYFKDEEPFLLWEIDIPVPHPLLLLPAHCLTFNHLSFSSLEMCYFKHDSVYGVGEIIHAALMVKNDFRSPISNIRRNSPTWKELREWKDIITSYIEMKNTLDQMDEGELDFIDEAPKPSEQQPQETAQSLVEKFEQDRLKDEKFYAQYDLGTKEIEETEKEYEKYKHLKLCLEDAAKRFQEERLQDIVEVGEGHNEEKEKKLEEEFYKFMKAYLLQKDLDVNAEDFLLEFEREDHPSKSASNPPASLPPAAHPPSKESPASLLAEISSDEIKQLRTNEDERESDKTPEQCEVSEEEFDTEQEEVCALFEGIEEAIKKGFEPVERKLDELNGHISRYEHIHVAQLNRCARIVDRERLYLTNIDSMISGYCNEFMGQFNETLNKGLKSYWQKIEDIDRKSAKERDKTVTQFGKFIDQQIRSRESLFDAGRLSIENHLSHIRSKIHLGQEPFPEEEEPHEDPQEQFEEDCVEWLKRLRQKQHKLFNP